MFLNTIYKPRLLNILRGARNFGHRSAGHSD